MSASLSDADRREFRKLDEEDDESLCDLLWRFQNRLGEQSFVDFVSDDMADV